MRLLPALTVVLMLLCLFGHDAMSQDFVMMNDGRYIELAVDMIRKGIQQEDTTKLLMVVAPVVSLGKGQPAARSEIAADMQAVFDGSARQLQGLRPMSRSIDGNPLATSDFWDFDILSPSISISGDTSVVDCQLVLWQALSGDGGTRTTRKADERLVFAACNKDIGTVASDDGAAWPRASGTSSFGQPRRSWRLVGCNSLFTFLGQTQQAGSTPGIEEGKGK